MKEIKKIDPKSVGKIVGIIYAFLGLLLGSILSSFSFFGSNALANEQDFPRMIFGVGAVIVLPIFYGGMGALISMLFAVIYNFVASKVGGIQIELTEKS